eukprot:4226442-Heterocapsa_arctica.AAC.1
MAETGVGKGRAKKALRTDREEADHSDDSSRSRSPGGTARSHPQTEVKSDYQLRQEARGALGMSGAVPSQASQPPGLLALGDATQASGGGHGRAATLLALRSQYPN